MFKTDSKYYSISKKTVIRRKTELMASDLIISIWRYLGNLNEFYLIKKRKFSERKFLILVGIIGTCYEFIDFTTMGYYKSRLWYTGTMVHLWKYMKYLHLLQKEDQELFINFVEFLIDYWTLCDNIKTYKHYLNPRYLIYDRIIQVIFKDYIIFKKSNILKFLHFRESRDLNRLNNTIFLE